MLDAFTEVLLKQASSKAQEDELTELMMRLPLEEVSRFASGTAVKLAYCGDSDGEWLKKYEGTPLFEQAIALEEELLAIEGKRIAKRLEPQPVDDLYASEDMIRLKKRLLDLELHKAGASSGEEETEEREEEEEPKVASDLTGSALNIAGNAIGGMQRAHRENKLVSSVAKPVQKPGLLKGMLMGPAVAADMARQNTVNRQGAREQLIASGQIQPKVASAKDSYRKSGIAGLGQHGGAITGGVGGAALGALAGRREMGGVMAPVALGTLGGLAGTAAGHKADQLLERKWGKVEKGSKEKESACKTAEASFDLAGRAMAHAMHKMAAVSKVAFTPFHAAAGGVAGAYNAPKGHRLEGAAAGAKGATLGALKGGAYHGATGAAGGAAAGLLPAALTGGLSVPVLATMGGVGGALEGGVSGGVEGYKKSMDELRAKVGQ